VTASGLRGPHTRRAHRRRHRSRPCPRRRRGGPCGAGQRADAGHRSRRVGDLLGQSRGRLPDALGVDGQRGGRTAWPGWLTGEPSGRVAAWPVSAPFVGRLLLQSGVLGVVDLACLLGQHDRDAVFDPVGTAQAWVVEGVLIGEEQERPLSMGTRGLRSAVGRVAWVSFAGGSPARRSVVSSSTRASTSATWRSHSSSLPASTLRRSRGSVFDGRRLYHQSPWSTVRPSRRSVFAPHPPRAWRLLRPRRAGRRPRC